MSGASLLPTRVTSSVIIPSLTDLNKFMYVLTTKDKKWGFPAGKLHAFEHPLDGAVREVTEETGLITIIKGLVGVWPFRSVSGNPIVNFVYVGEIIDGTPIAQHKEGISDVRAYTLGEVRELYKGGNLRGRANIEPLEEFLRNGRSYHPISIIKPVLMD